MFRSTVKLQLNLKHLTGDVDRYSNARFYVRMPGRRKARIRGVPGSDEFMAAYHAAIASLAVAAPGHATLGSLRHLCQLYYASIVFKALDRRTSGSSASERLFHASQSPCTFRHTRLTVSLPTAPPNSAASARRTGACWCRTGRRRRSARRPPRCAADICAARCRAIPSDAVGRPPRIFRPPPTPDQKIHEAAAAQELLTFA